MWRGIVMWYALAGVFTFIVYWLDKRAAVLGGGRRRVRERTLHVLALFGGIAGALVAQQVVRHKRRKRWFMTVTIAIALLHVGGWTWWLAQR